MVTTNNDFRGADFEPLDLSPSIDNGVALDFGIGLAKGVAGAVEGIGELGNLVGLEYDIPTNLGLGEAEGLSQHIGDFVGEAAATFATGSLAVKGLSSLGRVARVTRAARALTGMVPAKATQVTLGLLERTPAALKTVVGDNVKFALGELLTIAGDSVFDVVGAVGLDQTAVVEHLAFKDEDSDLSKRLKAALQGTVIGLGLDFGFRALIKGGGSLRAFGATIDEVSAVAPPSRETIRSVAELLDSIPDYADGLNALSEDSVGVGIKSIDALKSAHQEALARHDIISRVDSAITRQKRDLFRDAEGNVIRVTESDARKALKSKQAAAEVTRDSLDAAAKEVRAFRSPDLSRAKVELETLRGERSTLLAEKGLRAQPDLPTKPTGRKAKIKFKRRGATLDKELARVDARLAKATTRVSALEEPLVELRRRLGVASDAHELGVKESLDAKKALRAAEANAEDSLGPAFTREDFFAAGAEDINANRDEFIKSEAAWNLYKELVGKHPGVLTERVKAAEAALSQFDSTPLKAAQKGVDAAKKRVDELTAEQARLAEPLSSDATRRARAQRNARKIKVDRELEKERKALKSLEAPNTAEQAKLTKLQADLDTARQLDREGGYISPQDARRQSARELEVTQNAMITANARLPEEYRMLRTDPKNAPRALIEGVVTRLSHLSDGELGNIIDAARGGGTPKDGRAFVDGVVERLRGTLPGNSAGGGQFPLEATFSELLDVTSTVDAIQLSYARVISEAGARRVDLATLEAFGLQNNFTSAALEHARQVKAVFGGDASVNDIAAGLLDMRDSLSAKIMGLAEKLEPRDRLRTVHMVQALQDFDAAIEGGIAPDLLMRRAGTSTTSVHSMSSERVRREVQQVSRRTLNKMDNAIAIAKAELDRDAGAIKAGADFLSAAQGIVNTSDILADALKDNLAGFGAKVLGLQYARILARPGLQIANLASNAFKQVNDIIARTIGQTAVEAQVNKTFAMGSALEMHGKYRMQAMKALGRFAKSSTEGQVRTGAGSKVLPGLERAEQIGRGRSPFNPKTKIGKILLNIGQVATVAGDEAFKAPVIAASIAEQALVKASKMEIRGVETLVDDVYAATLSTFEAQLKSGLNLDGENIRRLVADSPSFQALSDKIGEDADKMIEGFLTKAASDAEDATFTSVRSSQEALDEFGPVAVLTNAARALNGVIQESGPLAKAILFPFVHTPINVFLYGSTFTPLSKGYWRGLASQVAAIPGLKSLPGTDKLIDFAERYIRDEPRAVKEIGAMYMGSAATAAAITGAAIGKVTLTGSGPDSNFREWMSQGGVPDSITIDGLTMSFDRMGAFALPLKLAAELMQLQQNPYGPEAAEAASISVYAQRMMSFVEAIGKTALEGSMFDSATQFQELMSNPTASNLRWFVANNALTVATSASPIPGLNLIPPALTIAGDVGSFFKAEKEDRPTPLSIAVGKLMPVQGDPRRNVFGEVVKKDLAFNAATWITSGISKLTPANTGELHKAMADEGMPVSPLSSRIGNVDLTDARYATGDRTAYDQLAESVGTIKLGGRSLQQAMLSLIRSRKYKRLSTQTIEGYSPRAREIRRLFNRYRSAATDRLTRSNPDLRFAVRNSVAARVALQQGKTPDQILNTYFQ